MSRSILMLTVFTGLALSVAPVSAHAQIPVNGWTDRPDALAPAGVRDADIPRAGSFDVAYNLSLRSFEGIQVETEEIPAELVLVDWDLAPLSMGAQRHEIEIRAGLLDWLGAAVRVPFLHTSTELVNEQFRGSPSASGLGDIEVAALIGFHDAWPFRAHLTAGLSIPTGAVDEAGQLPDGPVGGPDRTLPYPMQPGDGTFAFLPGAVFATENEVGTVGFKLGAVVPIGENDRGWTRGGEVNAQVWMGYRFSDWVSGSARVNYVDRADLAGADPSVFAFSSPLGHPDLQGGLRVEIPLGVNVLFAEGALAGSHLGFEVVVPVHQNLDGPQLKESTGASLTWGWSF